MPNPTLTWRISDPLGFAGAGANMTIAETLARIKTLIDTEAAGEGHWEVSDYNATNGTLEIKHKATSDTELAAMRILIFGGFTPHVSACVYGISLGATNLHIGVALGANTTGPEASYTAGNPYPSATWLPAAPLLSAGTPTVVAGGEMALFESEESLGIMGYHATNGWFAQAGRIIERSSDGAALFAHSGGGTAASTVSDPVNMTGGINWILPTPNTAQPPRGIVWNNGAARTWGSWLQANAGSMDPLFSAAAATLLPIPVVDGANTATMSPAFLGYLRQMRFGPKAGNKAYLRDANGGLQARLVAIGDGTTQAFGVWLDYVA